MRLSGLQFLLLGLGAALATFACWAQAPSSAQGSATAATRETELYWEEKRSVVDDLADQGSPLRLADALATIWSENPQVRRAELALRATDFEISGAKSGYYPFLAAQVAESEDTGNTIVRLVQPLWNGGLTGAQVDTARAQQLAALAELNQVRLQLGVQTAEAYFNVVQAQAQAKQWDRYRAALENLLGIIDRRTAEGVATAADVQTVVTRLRQAEASAQSVRAGLASNRAQLASLLDRDFGITQWPENSEILSEADVGDIVAAPINAHPERQAALAQVRIQQGTARANKAGLWPQLALEYRHQLDGQFVDETNDNTVVLTAQYQSNNGLSGYRAYQAEKQRIDAAQAALEAAVRSIRTNIRVAKAERDAAAMQIGIQDEASKASLALVDSFMRQFEVGRKSWLEVLNAHREANETILQSIAVKRNYWFADARLALQGLRWQKLSDKAPAIDVVRDRDQGVSE